MGLGSLISEGYIDDGWDGGDDFLTGHEMNTR